MDTHFSIFAWKISWTEEAGGLQSTGLQKSRTRLTYIMYIYKCVYMCEYTCNHTQILIF